MRYSLFTFLVISSAAWAKGEVPLEVLEPSLNVSQEAWFTGPLLTYSAENIPKGQLNIEPYVFATYTSSRYNGDWEKVSDPYSTWSVNILPFLEVGMTTWLDFTLVPSWFYVISNGSATFNFGDCSAILGFQLYKQEKNSYIPSMRLVLLETFPVGKFENLDPEQFGTDIAGAGSYISRVALAVSWLFHLWDVHWLDFRLTGVYGIAAKARVHGFNTYGGAFDTNGWVYPGQSAQIFVGFEFNVTQQWVFSCDFLANYNTSIRFKGFPGYDVLTGLPADLNVGSSAQYSMAPAIEYDWSETLGAISGVWFTFAGRNATNFISWVTALNYYY